MAINPCGGALRTIDDLSAQGCPSDSDSGPQTSQQAIQDGFAAFSQLRNDFQPGSDPEEIKVHKTIKATAVVGGVLGGAGILIGGGSLGGAVAGGPLGAGVGALVGLAIVVVRKNNADRRAARVAAREGVIHVNNNRDTTRNRSCEIL